MKDNKLEARLGKGGKRLSWPSVEELTQPRWSVPDVTQITDDSTLDICL